MVGLDINILSKEEQQLLEQLKSVMDPEIPVLSVVDLGIVTGVEVEGKKAVITMTPTFTGCPALDVMKHDLKQAALDAGYEEVEVKVDYSVNWNSNMISEEGKRKLEKFGLGIPSHHEGEVTMEMVEDATCPYCGSNSTSLNSPFGSALCRSIHYCHKCQQTFERFKPV